MDLRNRKEICAFASQRLENAPQAKTVTLIFAAVVIGLSLVVVLLDYVLGLAIDQNGGLSHMSRRTVLSALQTMLPLVQSCVVMCIELGFGAAMLRIARGQYVSPQTLRLGFDRFWVLLRYTVLETLIFSGIAISTAYLGIMAFLLSPLSGSVMEILLPLVSDVTVLDGSVIIPEAVQSELLSAMTPAYVIVGILFCIAALPLKYRLRMCSYVIIDKPALGAMAAMRESRAMMRGNCVHLFRLDVQLWWFYAASAASMALWYGDQILPALGVALPFSKDASYYFFYGLYWVSQLLIFRFLLPRVEVAYALAYDAVRPREEPQSGVVLGNIFQM